MQLRLLSLAMLPLLLQQLSADGCGEPDPSPDCPRPAAADDRLRRVVVSHPYDAAGSASPVYEVLELSTTGALTRPGVTFRMGRATAGEVVFTPDGQVGLVVQDDGTLGIFTLDDAGTPTVIDPAFEGSFYAGRVVMDPSGALAWVLDTNWRNNGGGIYALRIHCDGTVTDEGLVAPSKLPYAMSFLPDGSSDALLAATDVLSSAAGDDAHRVHLDGVEDAASLIDGADAFGDDDAIVASLAVTFDGRYGLIGDNNLFSGTGNRVAVVGIDPLAPSQLLTSIEDPVGLVASPYDNAALVVSGFGDALIALSYTPDAAAPFAVKGPLTYAGAKPQLPAQPVMIARGSLAGLVLVAETSGIRRVRFEPSGSITDLGLTSFGSGYTAIPGALGVQP
jgi:hypothetical protein